MTAQSKTVRATIETAQAAAPRLVEKLIAIAEAQADGSPAAPTWREKMKAIELVLAYAIGRPAMALNLDISARTESPRMDYSVLSIEELRALRAALLKAREAAELRTTASM